MNTIRDRLGQHGADNVGTTTATTVASGNEWFAIQGLWSITIIATLTQVGVYSGGFSGTVLFQNGVLYGAFTNFTLSSGVVRAYRAQATSG